MKYLKRKIDIDLLEWKNTKSRKPLMLRGARQVGKSSAIRELGKQFDYFLEINFENKDHAGAKRIFERHSNPKPICDEQCKACFCFLLKNNAPTVFVVQWKISANFRTLKLFRFTLLGKFICYTSSLRINRTGES